MACVSMPRGKGWFFTFNNLGLRYNYLKEKVDEKEIKLEYGKTGE